MTSLQVRKQLNDILETFHSSIQHPYLQKYLEDPSVDEDQATILIFMLSEKNLDADYINDCVVATILVQAALDTHDKVSEGPLVDELENKKRQLTVLAGDYYSSLYYYLLSRINDVALIKVLAKSIQQINESKMNVYKKHVHATSEDVKIIDSSLLQNIASMHQLPEWKELAGEFFYLKRLVNEHSCWLKNGVKGVLTEFIYKEKQMANDHDIANCLEKHISFTKERILQLTDKWDGFKNYIEERLNELLREGNIDKQHVMGERL